VRTLYGHKKCYGAPGQHESREGTTRREDGCFQVSPAQNLDSSSLLKQKFGSSTKEGEEKQRQG
jgi:hypothetical protein